MTTVLSDIRCSMDDHDPWMCIQDDAVDKYPLDLDVSPLNHILKFIVYCDNCNCLIITRFAKIIAKFSLKPNMFVLNTSINTYKIEFYQTKKIINRLIYQKIKLTIL